MSRTLPARPDLDWLKNRAKQALKDLRRKTPEARLADAQLATSREYGFPSWRALKEHVEKARVIAPTPLAEERVAKFLRHIGVGETAEVEAMLRETPGIVNAVGPHPFWGGRPQPLHVAIEGNRMDLVTLLLRAGADVNGTNDQYSHWSPLLLAIGEKRARSRKLLLQRGAKVGLVEALALGDDKTVLRMLKKGKAALPAYHPNDGSLLAFARTPAAIDRLLALGVSTELKDKWGATPMEALSRGGKKYAPLVRHLQAKGVPVDADAFARLGDRKTLARLIADDPSVAVRPTVVKSAVDFGHQALVVWLLDQGADVNARSTNASHDTCLHSAAWNGNLEMVELLLARGANPLLLDDEHHGTPAGWAEVSEHVTNNPACKAVAARLREAEAAAR